MSKEPMVDRATKHAFHRLRIKAGHHDDFDIEEWRDLEQHIMDHVADTTTIDEIQTKLDEAVIMLNKRQLKFGIVMVQNARHALDELKPLITALELKLKLWSEGDAYRTSIRVREESLDR